MRVGDGRMRVRAAIGTSWAMDLDEITDIRHRVQGSVSRGRWASYTLVTSGNETKWIADRWVETGGQQLADVLQATFGDLPGPDI